jgi:hypothetical protein
MSPASVTVSAGMGSWPYGFSSLSRTNACPPCSPVSSEQRDGAHTGAAA